MMITLHALCFQIGSRRVTQIGASIMVVMGMFGKVGALAGVIPDPVVGGILLVVMGAYR